jgi:riboflavin kinase
MTRDQTVDTNLELVGEVTSGMEEGRHFISKPGYTEQFIDRLGYEPFPGTLNVELDEESVKIRSTFDSLDAILIESWSDGETTFGGVLCYPVEVCTAHKSKHYDQCYAIVPKRTDHEQDVLEVIAPEKLREELDLSDGDRVELHVQEP